MENLVPPDRRIVRLAFLVGGVLAQPLQKPALGFAQHVGGLGGGHRNGDVSGQLGTRTFLGACGSGSFPKQARLMLQISQTA
jgi:hypothetical protein